MGKNTLANVPKEMAKFIGKANPESYNFHSLRRASAAAAVDCDATADSDTTAAAGPIS